MNTAVTFAASYDVEVAEGGFSEAPMGKPLAKCSLIVVPGKYNDAFPYLRGAPLFFFDVVRKLNRIGVLDRRVLFLTEYTINLASRRGHISRCAKVEDIAELICDAQARAVGVRMRNRPFALAPKGCLDWNCFHEMPVDLLLYASSVAQYEALLQVVRFVYHICTGETLPCRPRKKHEVWGTLLILAPDGSRVKKKLTQHQTVNPAHLEGSAAAAALGASRSHKTSRNPEVTHAASRFTSLFAIYPASGQAGWQDVSTAASTPRCSSLFCAPPSLRTCSDVGGDQTGLKSSLTRLGSVPPPPSALLSKDTELVPTSTTSPNDKPLPKTPRKTLTGLPEKKRTVTRLPSRVSGGTMEAAATAQLSIEASRAITLYPEELPPRAAMNRKLMRSLNAHVEEQQVLDAELRYFQQAKERELKASACFLSSFASSPYSSRYTSSSWSPRSFVPACSGYPCINDAKNSSDASFSSSSDSSVAKGRGSVDWALDESRRIDRHTAAASPQAELQLRYALQSHRQFEDAMWACYEKHLEELRQKESACQCSESATCR